MNAFRLIRDRLGLTQEAMAKALGMTQGNVHHYERGQVVMPATAKKLIELANGLGHVVTYEEIYGKPAVKQAKKRKGAPRAEMEA
jgi:putative transcriptional regulator